MLMDPEVPVVVLVLPVEVAPSPPTKPAFVPKFDWVVGCKQEELPEFCCPPPAPRGAKVMLGFFPPTFPPVAAAAAAAAAAASTFGGGGEEFATS